MKEEQARTWPGLRVARKPPPDKAQPVITAMYVKGSMIWDVYIMPYFSRGTATHPAGSLQHPQTVSWIFSVLKPTQLRDWNKKLIMHVAKLCSRNVSAHASASHGKKISTCDVTALGCMRRRTAVSGQRSTI